MLSDALSALKRPEDPDLLVGFETSDDAAVYRLSPDIAVVSTTDFITPPVDDPFWFGQIAAANAISDVYAMGGTPRTALNLVMYPVKKLGTDLLKEILRGGNEKVLEAGACMAGGHSVDDNEPKYGLAVTGVVHPGKVLTNCGARAGDALVLTKPIGSGVLFNACRSGKLPYKDLEPLLPIIASLNGKALEQARKHTIHSCTDITGFGMAGHTLEMAVGSCLEIRMRYRSLPQYPNALAMYRKGETTGSNEANRKLSRGKLVIERPLDRHEEDILFDPQTSGGLLLSLPGDAADALLRDLKGAGVAHAAIVGEVLANSSPRVVIV